MRTMNESAAILVVEDDPQISQFLLSFLGATGFSTYLARTLADAKSVFFEKKPALVILDLGLPDGDGGDLISQLRERSDVPILVLSARQSEQEKVHCLNLGADDYLSKPFGVDELHARIKVALRRAEKMSLRDHVYVHDGLVIDSSSGVIARDGELVHLSPIEFKLLMMLAQRPGKVFTHRQLLSAVWGQEYVDDTHYLRIHMGRLRAKIESVPADPRYLLTELGIGYRLAANI
jgi:two-component system KDP operon response regulator KdpE